MRQGYSLNCNYHANSSQTRFKFKVTDYRENRNKNRISKRLKGKKSRRPGITLNSQSVSITYVVGKTRSVHVAHFFIIEAHQTKDEALMNFLFAVRELVLCF